MTFLDIAAWELAFSGGGDDIGAWLKHWNKLKVTERKKNCMYLFTIRSFAIFYISAFIKAKQN